MYGFGWSILGVFLVALAIWDAVRTTLTVSGAGWLSSWLAGGVGRACMHGPRPVSKNASVIALGTSFVMWALLLWVGWTMVFCGSIEAVLLAKSANPATLLGRVYFAGFTLTTLGVGDYRPAAGVFQIATVIAAASGFLSFTLFVTYALSFMSALNVRRSIGATVSHLGETPEDIVLLLRDGGGDALGSRLMTLTSQLETAATQVDIYPVLTYSDVFDPRKSFARGVVSLGEAALLLAHAISPEQSLPPVVWKPLRDSVDLLVQQELRHISFRRTPPPPVMADFLRLQEGGLAVAPNAAEGFQEAKVNEMRDRWSDWLSWHGRDWREVHEPAASFD